VRKGIVTILMLLCLAALTGCNKKTPSELSGEKTGFTSEDFYQGNTSKFMPEPMLLTEKGYYYYSEGYEGFRYYDSATGKEMYLCNKPECKHEGSAFCVASNDKYSVIDYCLYDGCILAYVLEETDTQQVFKVISLALDGSSLSEVATVMMLEKTAQLTPKAGGSFYVHRNKALLLMWAEADENLGDVVLYGTAFLNLETGNVTYLDQEPMSTENPELMYVKAYGDWFYFCKNEGKKGTKKVLHRYHITEGTDESFSFSVAFNGDYVVVDDATVAYLREDRSGVYVHHSETGENEEIIFEIAMLYRYNPDGTPMTGTVYEENLTEEEFQEMLVRGETPKTKELPWVWYVNNCPDTILSDDTYIYIPMSGERVLTSYIEETKDRVIGYFHRDSGEDAWVRVFDRDLNEIAQINIYDAVEAVRPEDTEWEMKYYAISLRYMGEDIYLELCPKGNTSEWDVFRCTREDFLSGNPKFEYVFRMNREQNGEEILLTSR